MTAAQHQIAADKVSSHHLEFNQIAKPKNYPESILVHSPTFELRANQSHD
jgi:hypothetical protein